MQVLCTFSLGILGLRRFCEGFKCNDTEPILAGFIYFVFLFVLFDGEHQNACRWGSILFARCKNGEPDFGFAFLRVCLKHILNLI